MIGFIPLSGSIVRNSMLLAEHPPRLSRGQNLARANA
jgi:hypothetical protein